MRLGGRDLRWSHLTLWLRVKDIQVSSSTKRSQALQQAIEEGKTTYFTGKTCKYGHISERRVSDHSCIECRKTRQYQNDRDDYRQNTLERQISGKKAKSKKLGIPFDLKVEDLPKVTHCPILGIELDYTVNTDIRPDNKATLDRYSPNLGYVKGNVHIISWKANRLKSNGTLEEFQKLITWMKINENGRSF